MCFFLAAFKNFSLSSVFTSLISICLQMDFFKFILFKFCLVSCMCRIMFPIKFGEFAVIIFLDTFPVPFFLSFRDSDGMDVRSYVIISQVLDTVFISFSVYVLFVVSRLGRFYRFVFKFTDSIFFHLHSITDDVKHVHCEGIPLVKLMKTSFDSHFYLFFLVRTLNFALLQNFKYTIQCYQLSHSFGFFKHNYVSTKFFFLF